jgi:D-alanyl-lipoteichoic acid acyltransferase DltB (MBOAT superfamily)
LILGLFYFWAISVPLGQFSTLLQRTDALSSITYAVILEMFVYFNFAGLSFIAYALAGFFGFRIPLNFKQPFSSRNLLEYWKGWHLSLSAVLKELFYTPTRRRFGSFAAIMVVYMSSALWHGVSLNFLIWGLFHGLAYFGSLRLLKTKRKTGPLNLALLIVGVVLGRLLFGDSNSARLIEKLQFNFTDFEFMHIMSTVPIESKVALVIAAVIVCVEFFGIRSLLVAQRNYKFLRLPNVQIFLILITFVLFTTGLGEVFAVYGQR